MLIFVYQSNKGKKKSLLNESIDKGTTYNPYHDTTFIGKKNKSGIPDPLTEAVQDKEF